MRAELVVFYQRGMFSRWLDAKKYVLCKVRPVIRPRASMTMLLIMVLLMDALLAWECLTSYEISSSKHEYADAGVETVDVS